MATGLAAAKEFMNAAVACALSALAVIFRRKEESQALKDFLFLFFLEKKRRCFCFPPDLPWWELNIPAQLKSQQGGVDPRTNWKPSTVAKLSWHTNKMESVHSSFASKILPVGTLLNRHFRWSRQNLIACWIRWGHVQSVHKRRAASLFLLVLLPCSITPSSGENIFNW